LITLDILFNIEDCVNGNIISDRIYDNKRNPLRDIDYTNHGNPKQHKYAPHVHDWKDGRRY